MTVLINLPQRFQAVDGDSPFGAGIRMLPLLLASPVAIVVSGQLASRFKVPPFYLLLFASSLQMVGVGLTSSVPFVSGNQMYGYEVLMGFGFGMGLVSLLIFMPMVVTRADLGESQLPLSPYLNIRAELSRRGNGIRDANTRARGYDRTSNQVSPIPKTQPAELHLHLHLPYRDD